MDTADAPGGGAGALGGSGDERRATLEELSERAMRVRRRYAALEQQRYGRAWDIEEVALGFVGDVGDLAKLVLAEAGVRGIAGHREKLGHELADCLWSVLVLARLCDIDLARAFAATMDHLEARLAAADSAGRAPGQLA